MTGRVCKIHFDPLFGVLAGLGISWFGRISGVREFIAPQLCITFSHQS